MSAVVTDINILFPTLESLQDVDSYLDKSEADLKQLHSEISKEIRSSTFSKVNNRVKQVESSMKELSHSFSKMKKTLDTAEEATRIANHDIIKYHNASRNLKAVQEYLRYLKQLYSICDLIDQSTTLNPEAATLLPTVDLLMEKLNKYSDTKAIIEITKRVMSSVSKVVQQVVEEFFTSVKNGLYVVNFMNESLKKSTIGKIHSILLSREYTHMSMIDKYNWYKVWLSRNTEYINFNEELFDKVCNDVKNQLLTQPDEKNTVFEFLTKTVEFESLHRKYEISNSCVHLYDKLADVEYEKLKSCLTDAVSTDALDVKSVKLPSIEIVLQSIKNSKSKMKVLFAFTYFETRMVSKYYDIFHTCTHYLKLQKFVSISRSCVALNTAQYGKEKFLEFKNSVRSTSTSTSTSVANAEEEFTVVINQQVDAIVTFISNNVFPCFPNNMSEMSKSVEKISLFFQTNVDVMKELIPDKMYMLIYARCNSKIYTFLRSLIMEKFGGKFTLTNIMQFLIDIRNLTETLIDKLSTNSSLIKDIYSKQVKNDMKKLECLVQIFVSPPTYIKEQFKTLCPNEESSVLEKIIKVRNLRFTSFI